MNYSGQHSTSITAGTRVGTIHQTTGEHPTQRAPTLFRSLSVAFSAQSIAMNSHTVGALALIEHDTRNVVQAHRVNRRAVPAELAKRTLSPPPPGRIDLNLSPEFDEPFSLGQNVTQDAMNVLYRGDVRRDAELGVIILHSNASTRRGGPASVPPAPRSGRHRCFAETRRAHRLRRGTTSRGPTPSAPARSLPC